MTETMSVEDFRKMIGQKPSQEIGHKKSKFNNEKTINAGIKFDSKKEARRFDELMFLHRAKKISKPVLQYEFELVGCKYVCDFLYLDYEKKEFVVEDVKSEHTRKLPVFRIKKKQMKEIYGIEILET
jgi:hypothetical protein